MSHSATPIRDAMHEKLTVAFSPAYLEIIDESDKHRGHGGWQEGGETHFRVIMKAAAMDTMSRLERSRAVHKVVAREMEIRVHALTLELSGA
ncbi:MAG: BolA family protein [Pseudomonadota bacterium]